jgi:hypothetical protein
LSNYEKISTSLLINNNSEINNKENHEERILILTENERDNQKDNDSNHELNDTRINKENNVNRFNITNHGSEQTILINSKNATNDSFQIKHEESHSEIAILSESLLSKIIFYFFFFYNFS